ncbi:hypothetical protein NW762_013804 [Fusarium torreyae]|uniref:Peptidase S33 tripeptidyl aminopeptidase-like C-terminal domain-containing protein n=1 Tax=Fusarium torreyae TaxID=1237075 RepID=A0A9W8VA53_9HYPO|nr:hypothetical protein NW762_013804 [Fusarium torreyae]
MAIVNALDQGPQLNFWGVSYGTVLGQVAASMFPDRIGRMLLDGNLRADDYATTQWLTSFAGAELCPLADYHGRNTSGKSLMRSFDEKFQSLRNESPGGLNATESELRLTNAHLLKASIMTELYVPQAYPSIASRIEGLFMGNETAMLPPDEGSLNTGWNVLDDVFPGIACSDTSFRAEDPDDQFSMYQAHISQGSFAETTFPSRFQCAQWKFAAAEQIDLNKLRDLKTSSPILVVNSRYDPITSLSGAWEMSSQLRGSRVVVHQGVGHGLINHSSNCTQDAVTRYFVDGKMPELNTTCLPNMNAFEYAHLKISKARKNDTKQPEIAK